MPNDLDLICFSHLRWGHVFQRPNHLMTRCSRDRRVFFVEEPRIESSSSKLSVEQISSTLHVVTPLLAPGEDPTRGQEEALRQLYSDYQLYYPMHWFYTPMALDFARGSSRSLTVYDCMDELSAFRGAPVALQERERELFGSADLVFTGGRSLFQAKLGLHANIHLFPSSVDVGHFALARGELAAPPDQAGLGSPRIGYFGVIDERIDLALLEAMATARPDWQFVLLGPVVKIDPATLPRAANLHYLGAKPYASLPAYLSGWNVAIMPFASNESTRFISPTKTLEYLAGGIPVVSTPVPDVVQPYGELGLVAIADDAESFIAATSAALNAGGLGDKRAQVDAFVARSSWDDTWQRMWALMMQTLTTKASALAPSDGKIRSREARAR
ncbi:MAG: glycosyltransferase family 1 protein [Polyangiaceae bacterium]